MASVWSLANSHPTSDPRVRVGCWGGSTWRTLAQDEPGTEWSETGPPYPSKAAALAQVDEVLCDYFGEGPTRAMLERRIIEALEIAREAGSVDTPYVDRMVRALRGSA